MDFAGLLKETWDRFIAEIAPLVLFTLVGWLLCFTIILIPTVAGGWTRGFLAYTRDGTAPNFEELWNFDDFLPITLMIVLGVIGISIGYMLFFIPGVIVSVWWMYAMYFLLDRDMGVVEAFGASKEAVSHDGFANHLVVFLILCALGMLGGALSGIGSLLTTPFAFVMVSLVYLELEGHGRV